MLFLLHFFPPFNFPLALCILPRVIARARAAGHEAIQKKQRGLLIEPKELIAARLTPLAMTLMKSIDVDRFSSKR